MRFFEKASSSFELFYTIESERNVPARGKLCSPKTDTYCNEPQVVYLFLQLEPIAVVNTVESAIWADYDGSSMLINLVYNRPFETILATKPPNREQSGSQHA